MSTLKLTERQLSKSQLSVEYSFYIEFRAGVTGFTWLIVAMYMVNFGVARAQ